MGRTSPRKMTLDIEWGWNNYFDFSDFRFSAFVGYPWTSIDIHGNPWASIGIDRFSIDFPGRMDPPKYGLGTPRMGIMCRPHGKMYLVDDFSIRALKLVANREKQVFTFFAFSLPYIGVSRLPVYLKR